MKDKTLQEVCIDMGTSRRAIQGYEKLNLVSPTSRNDRGHLMYNEKAQERIGRIKFYQQLGFTLREIGAIIDAPNEVLKEALKNQIEKLRVQSEKTEVLIRRAYKLMETL